MRWRKFYLVMIVILWLGWLVPPRSTQLLAVQAAEAQIQTSQASSSDAGQAAGFSNSYAAVPIAATPNFAGNWSLEAWVYPTTTSGCRNILGMNYNNGLWFGLCSGFLRAHRGTASFAQSTSAVPANQWSHVAVSTYYDNDGEQYIAELFINGEREGFYPLDGDGTVSTARELRIGNDAGDFWLGQLAEIRVWNYSRGEYNIRRDMHSTLDQVPAGLLAQWHLTNGSLRDSISDVAAVAQGSITFLGFVSPALPATTPVDQYFNTLEQRIYGAASVYLPSSDEALLIGGYRDGAVSAMIHAINAGDGSSQIRGNLPVPLAFSSAAYADSNNTVYVFGGSLNNQHATVDTIYAINPQTGAVRMLAARLPQAFDLAAVVYHPILNKIVILGGYTPELGPLDQIVVFDVATESITPSANILPDRIYATNAVYSSATQNIYLIGGTNASTNFATITELVLTPDSSVSATTLAAQLPKPDTALVSFEDPSSKLIYVMNGRATNRVVAFDPQTEQVWRTPLELPTNSINTAAAYLPAGSKIQPFASAIYSPRQRHALILGGGEFGGSGTNSIWRIYLGDGPLVQLGRWDFQGFAGGTVQSIDGDGANLLVGNSDGMWHFSESASIPTNAPTQQFYPTTAAVGSVNWDTFNSVAYFGAGKNVYRGQNGGSTLIYDGSWMADGTVKALHTLANGLPAIGRDTIGSTAIASYQVPNGSLGSYTYQNVGPGCSQTTSIRTSPRSTPVFLEYWAINQLVNNCGPHRPSFGAMLPPEDYYPRLYRVRKLAAANTSWAVVDFGVLCNALPFQARTMAIGQNGDLWVAGDTGVCRYPAANLPDSANPVFNIFDLPYANNAHQVDVDADGRIWFSSDNGLSAFEVRRDGQAPVASLRASDFTHVNAPIGAKTGLSSLAALSAVGEKIYTARDKMLYSHAPRWNQFDLGAEIERLWTVRGRLFAATATMLHMLEPDGLTWRHYAVTAYDVEADQQGRIWVAHSNGVQLWLPTTAWQDVANLSLSEPVYSLAKDATGRMWLGLGDGVGLYDRGRLVTRLALPLAATPATALLVGTDNALWAGTSNGIARLDAITATWQEFSVANGGLPASDTVTDLLERPDGSIIASTTTGLVRKSLTANSFAAVAGSTRPAPLANDERGRLWAGASVETQPNVWQWFYWANSGIRSNNVRAIAADQSDRVWFAHPDGGISVRGAFLPPLAEEIPVISQITPTSAAYGQVVEIIGSGFGYDLNLDVQIGGATPSLISVSPTLIRVAITQHNLSGSVSVRRGLRRASLGTSSNPAFCAIPTIKHIFPTGTNVGGIITINGANFDPNAMINLGTGTPRRGVQNSTKAQHQVTSSDASGNLRVQNSCAGMQAQVGDVRRINVGINRVQLNQGYIGFTSMDSNNPQRQQLWSNNATMASVFVHTSQALRPTDRLMLDQLLVRMGQVGQPNRRDYAVPVSYTALPATVGLPPAANYRDVANALNVPNIIYPADGPTTVDVLLKYRSTIATSTSFEVDVAPTDPIRMLLVPVVPATMSTTMINQWLDSIEPNLADFRWRVFPGGIAPIRSSITIPSSAVHESGMFKVEDVDAFEEFGRQLENTRLRYNTLNKDRIMVAMGVIHPSVVDPESKAAGMGRLGQNGDWSPDPECENAGYYLSQAGQDDCNDEDPRFLGWGVGDGNIGKTLAHELGHMMGMVQEDQPTYIDYGMPGGDNHSTTSELRYITSLLPSNCGGVDPAIFSADLTLVRQPGVSEPMVNPISGAQLPNVLDGTSESSANRPKAILSYACDRGNANSFFEPGDVSFMRRERFGVLRPLYEFAPERERLATPNDEPERIHLTGSISPIAGAIAGTIEHVELKPATVAKSLDYQTNYQLVQYDAEGNELARRGVLATFHVPAHSHEPGTPIVHDHDPNQLKGLFSATIPKAEGVTRIDLVHQQTQLATWSAGPNIPSVSISSNLAQRYAADQQIAFDWQVADADGDPLAVSIEWSADDGANWQAIASATTSGSREIDLAQLAGTSSGRLRVWVSDGLHANSATSELLSIADQAPSAAIIAPSANAQLLESQAISFLGMANDPQTGVLSASASLHWFSDRDGDLGHGTEFYRQLSVGQHTISLTAINPAGLQTISTTTIEVLADYDGDGLRDQQELDLGLNLLTDHDALVDADGDGLSYRVELMRQTDPNNSDTDGDGRSDATEVEDGGNPLTGDVAPVDQLHIWPPSLEFEVDLAQDIQLPQRALTLLSRAGTEVTLSSDAAWLDLSQVGGTTPLAITAVLNPSVLRNGSQTATISISSSLGDFSIPVTVNASNKADFCDANGTGGLTAADLAAVQALVGAHVGDELYDYHADINRDGTIDQSDVNALNSCIQELSNPTPQIIYLPAIQRHW